MAQQEIIQFYSDVEIKDKRVLVEGDAALVLESGEGENSVQQANANALALGESSTSIGKQVTAGCKCYFIQGIDFDNKKIYIGETKQTDFSVLPTLDTNYVAPVYTIGKEFSIIAKNAGALYREHYHFCGKITAIENNVITYEGELPISGFGEDSYDYSPVFFVPSEPNIGAIVFTMGQTALGEDTVAAGENSLAAGYGSVAAGNYSTALGKSTKAAYGAFAAGVTTSATGQRSTALGWNTVASGDTSIAQGTGTKAMGVNAHSEGQATQAIGNTAHAEGYSTIAEGNQSHAEGGYTHAKGANSHAEGYYTIASSTNQHVEGKYNIEDTDDVYAVIVGNGEANSPSNAYTLDWDGNATFAGSITMNGKPVASTKDIENTKKEIDKNIEDTATSIRNAMVGVKVAGTTKGEKFNAATSAGDYAHAEGYNTNATGQFSHAEGAITIASGNSSHAEGNDTDATAYGAHAEGLGTQAIGTAAHAEGQGTVAKNHSHAEGFNAKANGAFSHAEGHTTIADHDHAHVEGINSQSTGAGGHAEGNNTRAGYFAHSEGLNTTASGSYSHAGGEGTKATAQGQTAIGRFNKADANALLIVGNGTGDSEELRSNAFVVKKDGTGYLGDKKILVEGDITGGSGDLSGDVAVNAITIGDVGQTTIGAFRASFAGDVNITGDVNIGGDILMEQNNNLASRVSIAYQNRDAGHIALDNCTWGTGFTVDGYGNAGFGAAEDYGFGTGVKIYGVSGEIEADNSITASNYITASAGITEMYEWTDGNANDEDRRGLFITLDGGKIRIATENDSYILGVIDPNPSLIGDAAGLEWKDKYLKDVFGSYIYEEVEVPATYDEEGNVLIEATTRKQRVINPEYDETQEYVSRTDRKEFAAITSKGKVVMIDDGTCVPNGYATVGANGIATHSENNYAVRVLERIDENHIKVLIDSVFIK